jgi:hypothetical protein
MGLLSLNLPVIGQSSATEDQKVRDALASIQTDYNGNVTDANISATAGIQESKFATGANGLARGLFMAYRAAAQSLGTSARVDFDAEEDDVSGWNALNIYTPQVAGWYRFSWLVSVSTTMTLDNYFQANLWKNAALYKAAPRANFRSNLSGIFSGHSVIAKANGTTDAFDIRVEHNNGGTVALLTGPVYTYWQAELIGRS